MRVPVRFVILALLAAEVLATVLVAESIGAWRTFAWFVLAFVVGLIVMRRAGAQAWRALRGANSGATPSAAVAGDTVLLFVAGLLLAIPGFLTDVVGLALLVPPVRHGVRSWLARSANRRFSTMRATFTTVRLSDGSIVIPGEVVEDDPSPPEPGEDRPGLPPA